MSDTFVVKVRFTGEKAFWFIGSGGRAVNRRVHALQFTEENARKCAEDLRQSNDKSVVESVMVGRWKNGRVREVLRL